MAASLWAPHAARPPRTGGGGGCLGPPSGQKWRSPRMEAREPVKENMGRGTGMGTLIPTCPASTRCWKYLWGMGGDRSEGWGGRGGGTVTMPRGAPTVGRMSVWGVGEGYRQRHPDDPLPLPRGQDEGWVIVRGLSTLARSEQNPQQPFSLHVHTIHDITPTAHRSSRRGTEGIPSPGAGTDSSARPAVGANKPFVPRCAQTGEAPFRPATSWRDRPDTW